MNFGPVKSTYTKTQSEHLTSLNNRATCLLKNRNIKNVLHEVNKQNCIFVKKCLLKRKNSSIFDNYFQVPKHSQQTRNYRIMLKLPSVKLEIYKQSFYFNGARLYNSLLMRSDWKEACLNFGLVSWIIIFRLLNFYV